MVTEHKESVDYHNNILFLICVRVLAYWSLGQHYSSPLLCNSAAYCDESSGIFSIVLSSMSASQALAGRRFLEKCSSLSAEAGSGMVHVTSAHILLERMFLFT